MSDNQMVIRLIDNDEHQVEELLQVNVENNNSKQMSDVQVRCRSDVMQALKENLKFEIQLPMQYDLDVNLEEGDLQIENLDSNSINVKLLTGSCQTKSLKSANMEINCQRGSITNNSYILGNYVATCQSSGTIFANKIQGSKISLTTDKGNIAVESIYCQSMDATTHFGLIHLGNCHGNLNAVADMANIEIGSLSGGGDISSQNGSITVHIDGHTAERIDLQTTEGNIDVTASSNYRAVVDLKGSSVNLDDKLILSKPVYSNTSYEGVIGDQSSRTNVPLLNAISKNGKIAMRMKEWFDSLQFKSR